MPREYYSISPTKDQRVLISELNRILDSISRRLNYIIDDGENVSLSGMKITNVAAGAEDSDGIRKDQIITVSSTFIANRLVKSNADTQLETVANLTSWIAGTADEITIANDGDGTVTISIPSAAVITFANSGLHILDTNASHDLIIKPGSNLTADKTLTITTGDANRTITLSGNPTLADWFDQAVKAASSPTFAALTQIGDATNKLTVAVDGEWTLHGTARVEKILESMVISGRGVSAPTQRTAEVPYLSYTFSIGNDVHQTFEAPYGMDYTYESYIKVHWYTHLSQVTDVVNWQCIWNAIPEAGGEAVNAGSTTDSSGDVTCPIQWEIKETLVETIPANSIAEGDVIGIAVERIAKVGGADPTAGSIHVLSIEWEYIANKYGKAL